MKDVKGREWDYCVLVTNDEKMDAVALSQLYRDRGDCENNFDEFKNQWGWSGFTTRKLKSCRTMARLIAIVANWWNVFNGKTLVMESFVISCTLCMVNSHQHFS